MIDRGEIVHGSSHGLGRLLAAATLARGADASSGVVIILTSVERYHSPAPGAVALAALLIPHVVAGPFAGIVTDRAFRPRLVHAGFVAVFAPQRRTPPPRPPPPPGRPATGRDCRLLRPHDRRRPLQPR